MTDTHELDQPEAAAPAADPKEGASPTPPTTLRNLGIVAILALLVLQAVLLIIVLQTNTEVAELRAEVASAQTAGTVPSLGGTSGQSSPGPDAGTAEPATGNLPRFLGGGADPALGRNIGNISGLEYYSGQAIQLAASDGKARAYMVWAHWCPYCQDELPVMAEWHTANAAALENFELVSITTSIDETAGNPLVPYLDENEFPFPVLFDEDGSMARKLGVNAFPFWVFVAPDGTVVGRAAGYVEADALADVFGQLNEMGSAEPAALGAGG